MSDFKILSDKDHILMRPGMYIGSTSLEPINTFLNGTWQEVNYVPGLVKIINEIIDNSVDEAIRTDFKYANKIDVKVDKLRVEVQDNGRGIPHDLVETNDGKIPTPVAAWTLAKAGSNFTDDRSTIGMNGVGSALTNFFSTQFKGTTSDGKNTIAVTCANNADGISWKERKGGTQGTHVEFVPDFSKFGLNEITPEIIELIRERLRALSIAFPDVTFSYNGKKIRESFKQYSKSYGESVVHDNDCRFMFASSEHGFLHNSFVNGVNTTKGGSHVDYIVGKVVDELIPLIKRRHKIVVTPARVRECLTFVLFMNMNDPKFDSQTKERLTNTGGEVGSNLPTIDWSKLAKQIISVDDIIDPIIEAELAKKIAAEKREATKAAKKAARAKVAKHVKAGGGKGTETTLFLTEGDSAIGYLVAVRDPKKHGGYPLRGKVRNTWGLSPAEQLKNKEIFEITSILGLKHGEPAKNLSYDNVAIMTDADADGLGAIYPLLLAFFYNWPDLFEQGKIMFCKTPVMISSNGKEDVWSYTEHEYAEYKKSGKFNKGNWKHRYIKGLGSLEESEYSRIINDPVMDVITEDEDGNKLFEMLFGDDSQLRKDWLINNDN